MISPTPISTSTQNSSGPALSQRPLRILEVASCMPRWGGTESHLVALSKLLTERGHHVSILCQPGSFVEAEANKSGLPILHATIEHQSDFSALPALSKAIRSQSWDVVHVHWEADYLLPPIIARLAKVPVVVMSHHSPYPLKKKAWKQRLWRGGLFDKMVALSESVRQMLLSNPLPADKVVTIHHGTDTEKFRAITVEPEAVRREWQIPPDSFVVGIAGRVALEKGIDVFLRALAALEDIPWRGVIIGDGTEVELLKTLAAGLGISDRLVWAGFRADVNNAINALDTLVLASTWAEPCAAVVQQAMALGKPVIGTDAGGTPEMIAKEITGLLVPPGDVDALSQAIRTLATDADLRQRMGQAGRLRADELFTLRRMVDRNEALYQDVLAQKGR